MPRTYTLLSLSISIKMVMFCLVVHLLLTNYLTQKKLACIGFDDDADKLYNHFLSAGTIEFDHYF